MDQLPVFLRFDSESPRTAVDAALSAWFTDNGWSDLPRPGARVGLFEKGRSTDHFAAHVAERSPNGALNSQYVIGITEPTPTHADSHGPAPSALPSQQSSPQSSPPSPIPAPARPLPGPRPLGPAGAAEPAEPAEGGSRSETAVTLHVDSTGRGGRLLIQYSSDAEIRSTPAVARRLIAALHGTDGGAAITAGARMVQPPGHADVLSAIRSPQRLRPLLVFGSAHGIKLRRLKTLVDGLLADADGLLLAYVLDGPATSGLNQELPPEMRVAPGCARIFHPLRPGLRHTGIGTERLLDDEYGLRRELWHLAAGYARSAVDRNAFSHDTRSTDGRGAADGSAPLDHAVTAADAADAAARLRTRIDSCHAAVPRVPAVPMPPAGAGAAQPPVEWGAQPPGGQGAPPSEPQPPVGREPTASRRGPSEPTAGIANQAPAHPTSGKSAPGPGANAPEALLSDLLYEVRGERAVTADAIRELRALARRGLRRARNHDHARTELVRLTGELAHARGIISELRAATPNDIAGAPHAYDTVMEGFDADGAYFHPAEPQRRRGRTADDAPSS